MIVTIDGPAGAGKSTAARRLAAALGFRFLDTGAMYRAVTLDFLRNKIDTADTQAVRNRLQQLKMELDDARLLLNGEDVTTEIRSQEVTRNIGPVADHVDVRMHLINLQRQIAAGGDFVCEGRDQGTVVFPGAECKFYLDASPEHRAQRRLRELEARNVPVNYTVLLGEQTRRDERDRERPFGKLEKAADAIEILTDDMTLIEVVAVMKQTVRDKIGTPRS